MIRLLLTVLLAGVQDEKPAPQGPPPEFSKTILTLSTDDSIRPHGRRDDGGGDVDVTQTKLSLEALHLRNFRDFYRLSGAVERVWYDFEETDELEDAYAFRTDANWVHVFGPQ